MKKLLISVVIISLMLVACGDTKGPQELDITADTKGSQELDITADTKDLQESDSTKDVAVSEETIETNEANPVPAPVEEDAELEDVTEDADETEVPEIPESDRGTNTYSTYVPQVAVFEISDGVLTVVSDTRFNWDSGEKFSISYPVAEGCVWETGYFSSDFVAEDTTDYESVKAYIEKEQAGYTEDPETGEFGIESPMGIYIEVTDGMVVRVYTAFS